MEDRKTDKPYDKTVPPEQQFYQGQNGNGNIVSQVRQTRQIQTGTMFERRLRIAIPQGS